MSRINTILSWFHYLCFVLHCSWSSGTQHWCCCTLPQLGFDSVQHHHWCRWQVVHHARNLGAAASVWRHYWASATKTATGSVARPVARIGVAFSSAAHGMQGTPCLQARSFSFPLQLVCFISIPKMSLFHVTSRRWRPLAPPPSVSSSRTAATANQVFILLLLVCLAVCPCNDWRNKSRYPIAISRVCDRDSLLSCLTCKIYPCCSCFCLEIV